ncbi:TPA: SIR2 family protein [Burkholderia vietnamiensis]|nr:SIR2 family protein [Burkholderia vietnamiensis]
MPTKAHRAIAKLALGGYVRLIITTNFDRLMERALEDEGVAPIVLSSPDHIDGAPPLAHMRCCVVKVHGDYLDTRIRNTLTELEEYDPRMDKFLDRVFDEFGLVTCGWSAEWDTALRAAIERAPSRRYSMFWASRGEPGTSARSLIALRGGMTLPINDADSFFDDLQGKVDAVEEFNKPHPLSKDIAVASTKRFLVDPLHRIRLSDLVDNLGGDLANQLRSGPFSDTSTQPTAVSATARIRTYDAMTSTLAAVATACGRWGGEHAAQILRRAIARVYAVRQRGGLVFWLDFQNYPATLIAYAALLGASLGDNLIAMSKLFGGTVSMDNREIPVAKALPPACFLQNAQGWGRLLEGMQGHHAPVNDWLQETLWNAVGSEFISTEEFEEHFDWVEIIIALACHHCGKSDESGDWYPAGCYGYRGTSRAKVIARISTSLDELGDRSPYVLASIFGDSVDECKAALAGINPFVGRLGWW